MRRLLDLIGMSIGGGVGWFLGSLVSVFLAFVVSMVGMGAGLYLARRITKGLT